MGVRMSEQDTSTTEAAPEVDQDATTTDQTPADLGDPGKKALAAERQARREAEKQLREFRDRLTAMEEAQNKTAEERAALEQQRELEKAALAKANERILKAEVRAAAADKLADPADALRFVDLTTFEVGDDGSVDGEAISAAIEDLIGSKPYLAKSRDAAKVQGSADGGTREASRPRQLTRADLARMSVHDIEQARQEGRLDNLLSGKT